MLVNYNGFIYLWINLTNGKLYVGSHWGKLDDGYIGSGVLFKKAVKKYGIHNFSRTILEIRKFRDRKDLQETEIFFLKSLNVVQKSRYYNMTDNAGSSLRSKEACAKQAAALRGRKQSQEQINNRMNKLHGINHPQFKGWWITPVGRFITAREAAIIHKCSYRTIMDRCKSSKLLGWRFEGK